VPRRSINTDAFAPSIDVIDKKIRAHDETLDAFNPFSESESEAPLTNEFLRFSECASAEESRLRAEKHDR